MPLPGHDMEVEEFAEQPLCAAFLFPNIFSFCTSNLSLNAILVKIPKEFPDGGLKIEPVQTKRSIRSKTVETCFCQCHGHWQPTLDISPPLEFLIPYQCL